MQGNMATSVNWVRREILQHQYDGQPVSVILEVTVTTAPHLANNNPGQIVARNAVLQAFDVVAHQLISQHKPFENVVLSFYRNPHVSAPSKHYLSRSGHNDIVKTIVVQQFFDQFNQQHKHLGGRISWLLTKPLDFVGLHAADQASLVEDYSYQAQLTQYDDNKDGTIYN
jgi:hypothetical protein